MSCNAPSCSPDFLCAPCFAAAVEPGSARPKVRCNDPSCAAEIERKDGSRCGGVLFGLRDESVGCGRFFCGDHAVGKRGPFFCRPCWEARKAARP